MPYKDKDKQREFAKKWTANRRSEFFAGKVCVKCGDSNSLELDHINRSKKTSHKIWSWSKERRDIEIAKCQILCKSCHLAKTVVELGKGTFIHGSKRGYLIHKCSCVLCQERGKIIKAHRREKYKLKKCPSGGTADARASRARGITSRVCASHT